MGVASPPSGQDEAGASARRGGEMDEANRLFKLAEKVAHVGHWRLDVATNRRTWSDEMLSIFGMSTAAPPPRDMAEAWARYHPDDRPRVSALVEAAYEAGQDYEYEARIPRDGGERIVLVRGHHERDAEGRITAIFGTAMDITASRRTEQRLRDASALLSATLDNMNQGLILIDGAGIIAVANRRAATLLGVDPAFLNARPHYMQLSRMQFEAGEYDSMGPEFIRWIAEGGLDAPQALYERRRPNGTILEVSNVTIEGVGSLRTYTDVTARRRAESELRSKTEMLDATLESMHQGIMAVDASGVVRVCNERAMELLDLPAALMRRQPSFREVCQHQLGQDDFSRNDSAMRRWVERGGLESTFHTYERERPNGKILEISTVPKHDGVWVRTYTDITERKRAEAALQASEERLMLALDAGSDGVWDCDLTTGEVWRSDRVLTMLGYEPSATGSAKNWRALVHPDDRKRSLTLMRDHIHGRSELYECEYRLRRADGKWAWVHARGKVVSRNGANRPLRMVGTHIDIDARKQAERRIVHLARHDALTDLPNRTLFGERLRQRVTEIERSGASFAVLCLDLDRFKAVNDTLGHLAGDQLLQQIATRLATLLRAEDMIARIGGDEFAVLLDDSVSHGRVALVAERLIAAVGAPVSVCGQQVEVGLSVGIALAPAHGLSAETLMNRADLALYRAKAQGRQTYRFFDDAMDEEAADRRQLEIDLRSALVRGEFELDFQPQVDCRTGEQVAFEALVRWRHPTRGLVSPDAFVPIAEETGLILPIGEWVLEEACRAAATWPEHVKVAVNLSPRQFQQTNMLEIVLGVLVETGLAPTRLELEITESLIINDNVRALTMLRQLKALGVRIAMDDFGTGYASLATLQSFPFDTIKIDRTFVGKVDRNAQAAIIVRAVLGLGRSLGMTLVAEGVERPEQLRFLIEEGCDQAQGFLLGRPRPMATDMQRRQGSGG